MPERKKKIDRYRFDVSHSLWSIESKTLSRHASFIAIFLYIAIGARSIYIVIDRR